jgi:hypothetical protein
VQLAPAPKPRTRARSSLAAANFCCAFCPLFTPCTGAQVLNKFTYTSAAARPWPMLHIFLAAGWQPRDSYARWLLRTKPALPPSPQFQAQRATILVLGALRPPRCGGNATQLVDGVLRGARYGNAHALTESRTLIQSPESLVHPKELC